MTAQQWLDDLEAKADEATYFVSVHPSNVKRLVAMVRVLADRTVEAYGKTAQGKYAKPALVDGYSYPVTIEKTEAVLAWIDHAYKQTEPTNAD